MTTKERLQDMLNAVLDRIRAEPVLLWAVLYGAWQWRWPDASPAADLVIVAIGVLFMRSLSTPTKAAEEAQVEALKLGAIVTEAELRPVRRQIQAEPRR